MFFQISNSFVQYHYWSHSNPTDDTISGRFSKRSFLGLLFLSHFFLIWTTISLVWFMSKAGTISWNKFQSETMKARNIAVARIKLFLDHNSISVIRLWSYQSRILQAAAAALQQDPSQPKQRFSRLIYSHANACY